MVWSNSRFVQVAVGVLAVAIITVPGCVFAAPADDALKYFKQKQDEARDRSTVSNMHALQIAAESYRLDYPDYPNTLDNAFKSYFPGGSSDKKLPGKTWWNAITAKEEWPIVCSPGQAVKATAGQVVYICAKDRKSYAIYGVGRDGKYILSKRTGKALVLTPTNTSDYGR
jgi:hypothetical protein